MPSDRSSLTTAEVDAVFTATATSRLLNGKNAVNFLGNISTPTLNLLRSQGSANATPVRGAYKCQFSGKRGGRLQSISGRDIHVFKSVDTLFDVEYSVGRVHLGDEWVHQQLEEAGIEIDHASASQTQVIDTGKPGWWKKGADSFEVLCNLADAKNKALEINYTQELNKLHWRSNLSDAKLWQGLDAIVSRSSSTSGAVGNRTRANPLLRHNIKAISAASTIENDLSNLRYRCNRMVGDGSKVNLAVCGRTFYEAITAQMFTGNASITSPRLLRNLDAARSEAQARAQKLAIGIPDDAVYIADIGFLTTEPVFEDLDKEDAPAILWDKSCFLFNLEHIDFKPTKKKDGAKKIHATPYNQAVTRISMYGEYALVADQLDCHGVAYLGY